MIPVINYYSKLSRYVSQITFILFWSSLLSCTSNVEQINELSKNNNFKNPDNYVIFEKGNIPLILVSTHGGDQKPNWLEDRDCEGSVVLKDLFTLGIALQIRNELISQGFKPYTVFSKIHRIKVDLNRSLPESYCDIETSNLLWTFFHDQIRLYRQDLINQFKRGLIIDIHGHGHPNQRIELGYLFGNEDLDLLNNEPNTYPTKKSSINSLIENHPEGLMLSDLISGKFALGTMLDSIGYPSVPSENNPLPGNVPYFSGGYITKQYGSSSSSAIDAIQLELNRYGIREESEDRKRFAESFSKIIMHYLSIHYSDAL